MNVIYTVGYEGSDINTFVKTLKAVGIDSIADVRAVPLSRKKGFSKNSLSDVLLGNGIDYLSFKLLGDPKSGREAAKSGNYKLFKKIYSEYLSEANAQSALIELASLASEKRICLLCFERDYKTCHRNLIANELKKSGFSIVNLIADDPSRYELNKLQLHHYLDAAE